MDRTTAQAVIESPLQRFAGRLRDDLGAERVLLFSAHARGDKHNDEDYELIVVSPQFRGVGRRERTFGLREKFYDEGGDAPMRLICLTPEEFGRAKNGITFISAVLPEAIDLLPEQKTTAS